MQQACGAQKQYQMDLNDKMCQINQLAEVAENFKRESQEQRAALDGQLDAHRQSITKLGVRCTLPCPCKDCMISCYDHLLRAALYLQSSS